MLLGILSDTHDKLARTQTAVAILKSAGAEALIHCGDFVDPEILVPCAVLPLYFVFGNNDADVVPNLERMARNLGATCLGWWGVVELDDKRIGVTHGHNDYDLRMLKASLPDYILTGHSHIAHNYRKGSTRYINPGAIHRARPYSVALLDLGTDELQIVDVPG
jgi:uncharacterized protein